VGICEIKQTQIFSNLHYSVIEIIFHELNAIFLGELIGQDNQENINGYCFHMHAQAYGIINKYRLVCNHIFMRKPTFHTNKIMYGSMWYIDFIRFLFFSMNLYELIKKNNFQGFSIALIRRFAFSLLQCLKLLHREKIIHCDLKPVSTKAFWFLVYAWRLVLFPPFFNCNSTKCIQFAIKISVLYNTLKLYTNNTKKMYQINTMYTNYNTMYTNYNTMYTNYNTM